MIALPRLTPIRVNLALFALGLLSLGLYWVARREQGEVHIQPFTFCALGLALPYFAASWLMLRAPAARSTWIIALIFAAVFRLMTLHTPAHLSTDLYRYIWDGRVQAAGINPYRYVPADPALEKLRDRKIYAKINRKDYARTIYAPVAQAFFWLVTRIREAIRAMRLAMILCEVITLWALSLMLTSFGLPQQRLLLYAWHPLAIWEFSSGGHVDALMIAFTVLALLAARRRIPAAVGGWLAGAVLVKLFPLVLFPALWRRWNWKMPVAFTAAVVLAYTPYVWTYNLPGALGFLPDYTSEEGLQSGDRFYLMNLIPGLHAYGIFVALAATAVALIAFWIFFAPEYDDYSYLRRSLALATIFVAVLSPGYDWYYTWLIPFLCFLPYPWLFWFTAAPFVLYFNWDWSELDDAFWQNSFIVLPAVLLGLVPLARRRFLSLPHEKIAAASVA